MNDVERVFRVSDCEQGLFECTALDAREKLRKFVSRGQMYILFLVAGAAAAVWFSWYQKADSNAGKSLTNKASPIRL